VLFLARLGVWLERGSGVPWIAVGFLRVTFPVGGQFTSLLATLGMYQIR